MNFASFLSVFYVLLDQGDAPNGAEIMVVSPEIQAKIDEHKARKPQVFFDISINGEPTGKIVFTLYWDDVPITAENFYELATGENGYGFRGSTFHRIIPGFVVQGGDFIAHNGTGGKSIYGAKFNDENFLHNHDKVGLLSMANYGPNTNLSQFSITVSTPWHLNGHHVVYGEVSQGYDDVVKKMEAEGNAKGSIPPHEVKITKCGEYNGPEDPKAVDLVHVEA